MRWPACTDTQTRVICCPHNGTEDVDMGFFLQSIILFECILVWFRYFSSLSRPVTVLPVARWVPKRANLFFCLATTLKDRLVLGSVTAQPPSVRAQPPSVVVPVPFQLGPRWTPKSRTLEVVFILVRDPPACRKASRGGNTS